MLTNFGVSSFGRTLPKRGVRNRISGKFDRWNLRLLGAVRSSNQSALVWLDDMEPVEKEPELNAERGMTENTEQTEHPWNTLTTITTFDQGTDSDNKSTFCLNNSKDESNKKITPAKKKVQDLQVTTVLIESLLQQLCDAIEQDQARSEKLFNAICEKLHEMKLISNTYNVVEFKMLRGKYQHALCRMFSAARGEPESDSLLFIPKSLPTLIRLRYHEEFQEISFIARGGFGEVYKARHRLDGSEYAIKKIAMPADQIEIIHKQLNEVRTLAKLNHTNIVSYHAAWIETLPSYNSRVSSTNRESYTSKHERKQSKSHNLEFEDSFNNKNSSNLTSKIHHNSQNKLLETEISSTIDTCSMNKETKRQSKIYKLNNSEINNHNISTRFKESNSSLNITEERINEKSNEEECIEESSSDVSFQNSKSNENLDKKVIDTDTSSDVVSFQNSKSNENSNQIIVHTDTSNSYSHEDSSNQKICMYTSNKNRLYVTLYIQMALCEQTLEKWLRDKISVTPEPIARAIFQQILYGVDYMHSQKIVHHDIKPSNIFISTSGRLQIQLGDFGLACPLKIGTEHSVVGTHMYAAPEQLQGKCDPKSDIYSIGIVLVELLIPIKTQMELSSIIRSLKCGKMPECLTHHKWAQIIKQLVQKDPTKRPSTNQLLQDIDDDKDVIINGLKDTIVNLQKDSCVKDDTIQKLQDEIALLKEKVRKLSIQQTDNTKN
ncbi:eukaryotic translation initiation factor 2-alpha kinase 1 isoform X4 [Cardiocondyla obscurior]|uniref:eukaryotic translation initiation factor 2-alpha kinase 1 isoform X4 n=1 Tax=Cardiocondyla obscurior TaxID=286306 RepID=UPI00396564C2